MPIDGDAVVRSPVFEFYNNDGDVPEGLRLLVHLLSPLMTKNKTPWVTEASASHPSASSILPEDLIRHILRFTDEHTYHFVLPYVSCLVRSICLAQPHIGDFVIDGANLDGTYQALSSVGSSTEIRVKLVQKHKWTDKPFLHVFQTHQTGTGEGTNDLTNIEDEEGWLDINIPWDRLMNGLEAPTMPVQVVGGIWGLEEVSE
ncbi:microtubule-actin cross-linking factor 1 [Ceratobasidium sp. AG-Ba]|nr:microtubule-actin cross-linking factor 1 [Ceratobasidium sp. AG-Ba]QRV73593.1 microtubule-actin cross-linking factor 1 [Ceratobasidium sp. AG-Ba]QRV73620.1 microtubule-actin cross-linking factor 1 [Ceratobasidium sp. AG-Ba]QRW02564.1 microtubule-actin cross-linking factor 1 [Ceratobasidium sp. AG-Ba]